MKGKLRFVVKSVLLVLAVMMLESCSNSRKENQDDESSRYVMYVASEGLNVRLRPNADARIVHTLFQNDRVLTDKVSHDGWYKVSALDESAEGYVNAYYLSDERVTLEQAVSQQQEQPVTRSAVPEEREEKTGSAGQSSASALEEDESETPRATLTKRSKSATQKP